jgi:LCP family protein required for cell wall assembly
MKTKFIWTVVLVAMLISACGSTDPAPAPAPQRTPFILVTAALNATATPTPFQPIQPTYTPALEDLPTLAVTQSILPTNTAIPSSTPTTANPTAGVPPTASSPLPPLPNQDTINFLLIGSDKRPGGSFRTDTMLVAILRPKDEQVTLISIPRDLWVNIPAWGMQRINTAYQHGELTGYPGGGPGLLKTTIETNLGVRIDHTAMVEFDGFRRIVDTLGGIDIPISCPYTDWRLIDPSYDPENENNWWLYTVGPGIVHMDGDMALWYARSRMKSSDFDRGRRQQEVLRAIYSKALSGDTLSKIPQLYADLNSLVATDLGLVDILQMASIAPHMTNANIRSYYIRPPLVTPWITPGGAYVLLPNDEQIQQMVLEASSASPRAEERERVIVQVENGTLVDGQDALAVSRLNYAGFNASILPADRRDYTYSVLVDLTPTQDLTQRASLLAALGLTNANVISMPDPNSQAAYKLILGSDYQSCFNPENMAP